MQWRCTFFRRSLIKRAKELMCRNFSVEKNARKVRNEITLLGQKYRTDEWTNITSSIQSKLGRNLHIMPDHPLSHIKHRVINYFYNSFRNRTGNPVFSVYENLSPVVSVNQNFESLLVPKDHPSRKKGDCYYVNEETLLRAHTTAHQAELISSGLNNFLVVGDVYRRDEIDRKHYPVFHQIDGVRLRTTMNVFQDVNDADGLSLFENTDLETPQKQSCHTLESVKIMEDELKTTLVGLAKAIFGPDVKYRWVEEMFPFTHPSWELEVEFNKEWIEVLGCGIMRQEILERSGARDQIGWAFGLGLERLAMYVYKIPDIRLFWSTDTGFLHQFKVDPNTNVKYKPISIYPQCHTDVSFWLPEDGTYISNDFYDLVRDIGGDMIEQVILIDQFVHPKTKRESHCYRITCRHMERTLSRAETNEVIDNIRKAVTEQMNVTMR